MSPGQAATQDRPLGPGSIDGRKELSQCRRREGRTAAGTPDRAGIPGQKPSSDQQLRHHDGRWFPRPEKGAGGPRVLTTKSSGSFRLLSFPQAPPLGAREPAAVRSRGRGSDWTPQNPEPSWAGRAGTRTGGRAPHSQLPGSDPLTGSSEEGPGRGAREPTRSTWASMHTHRARPWGAHSVPSLPPTVSQPGFPRRPWVDPKLQGAGGRGPPRAETGRR